MNEIREGKVSKGGQNKIPTTPRPAPPSGQGKKELGIKFDQGKHLWNLIPWVEMEEVVEVLMMGAKKYSPDNWMHVDRERYEEALMRHSIDYMKGNKIDDESGKSHLAHAICCCLFIMWKDNQEKNEKNS